MTNSFKVNTKDIEKVNEIIDNFIKKIKIKKIKILKEKNINFVEVSWNNRYFTSLGLFGDEIHLNQSVEDRSVSLREGTLKSMLKQFQIFENQFEKLKKFCC